jgi:hypothetical protein
MGGGLGSKWAQKGAASPRNDIFHLMGGLNPQPLIGYALQMYLIAATQLSFCIPITFILSKIKVIGLKVLLVNYE